MDMATTFKEEYQMFRVEYFYRCTEEKLDIVGCEMLTNNPIPNGVLFAVPNPKQDWFLFHKAVATHRYYIPAFLMKKTRFWMDC